MNVSAGVEGASAKKSGADAAYRMVTRSADLVEIAARARAAGRFALDTEFVMEDVYEPELCLVQMALPDGMFLIDALTKVDLAPLWDLVTDPAVETVVHAGQEDLAICAAAAGRPPRKVYDVQVAAGLVGPIYPISLSKLTQQVLHVRMHKSQTLTDWRKRPLTEDQLRYAAEDVAHLLPIRDKLHARLTKLDRVSWAEEEFAVFEQMPLYARPPEDRLRRVKGTGSLSGSELRAALDLMAWREELAGRLNRPARAVLKDHLLVEIARHGWTRMEQIRSLRGLNLRKDHLREMCEVLEKSAKQPPAPRTGHRSVRSEHPLDGVLISLLTAVLRSEAARLDVAYSLLATKQAIQGVVEPFVDGGLDKLAESPLLMRGWRGEAVGRTLRKILRGASAIQVNPSGQRAPLRIRRLASSRPGNRPSAERETSDDGR
ncbi:MAG: HRDC domain-containing protein [Phycisphaerae bacterium]|nr:MAG: ribonuclease D [Planctomycetota bacterium]KAB2948687.1 MAG: ribonuclease D [Phycisphaerae bacterium]MBE7455567.1 ribonuclease D [Planctomycetia bacterium]MCK6466175.1 HRDC domain-containing protein [Phycisphaerae bacterium]MCL4719920.1 HRDC domain-containing protein [Phycisphaerae bacterium]